MNFRKIRLRIRTKIFFLFLVLLCISLGSYCVYVLDIFHKDKKAYIFDSLGGNTEILNDELSTFSKGLTKRSFVIGAMFNKYPDDIKFLDELLEKEEEVIIFKIYDLGKDEAPQYNYLKKSFLVKNNVKAENLEKLTKDDPSLEFVKSKKIIIQNNFVDNNIVFSIFLYNANENEVYSIRANLNWIISDFRRNKDTHNILLDSTGRVIIHKNKDFMKGRKNLVKNGHLKDIFNFMIKNKYSSLGTKEVDIGLGKKLLVSYKKNSLLNFYLISEISKEKAFEALEKIIQDSIAFGLLIISLSFLLVLWLAASLTRPIKALMEGTSKVSEGDFKHKITVKSSDELGVLSDSFNYMSEEIQRYTSELKEKARMANELAVAQLVQSSFFPSRDVVVDKVSLSGYYTPASECGGDWWGYKKVENKLFVFVGDATGHGVPAALITATANCCINLLDELVQGRRELLSNPASVMSMLNKVVHDVGGKILMTFFVGVIDLDTYELIYTNASHNPPYYFAHKEGEVSKGDIDILLGEVGPRLGHKKDAEYTNESIMLNEGDVLLLCTDGMIEGLNPEDKMYGERRFIKSFAEGVRTGPRKIIEKLLIDGNNFFEGVPVDDDITLVALEITKG